MEPRFRVSVGMNGQVLELAVMKWTPVSTNPQFAQPIPLAFPTALAASAQVGTKAKLKKQMRYIQALLMINVCCA